MTIDDDTGSSIGGVMPDGDALDHVANDELPGVSDSAIGQNGPNGTSEEND